MSESNENTTERLLAGMATGLHIAHGFSIFSASAYDAAWAALVERPGPDVAMELAFADCLDFLLQAQQADGSWRSDPGRLLGSILNTMAALLALQRRAQSNFFPSGPDLASRCAKAKAVLVGMVRSWDIASWDLVGLEVIMPALMRLLDEYGYHFEEELPGKHGTSLTAMSEKKVSKLFPMSF